MSGEGDSKMLTVSVRDNFKEFERKFKDYPKQVQAATLTALDKAAAQAKTQMVQTIAAGYNVKQSDIKQRLAIRKARRGKAFEFTASIIGNTDPSGRKRSFNLIRFVEKKVTLAEAKRRRKSDTLNVLRFQIKKGGGRTTIKGAFIGNKGRTVFRRTRVGRDIEPVQTIGVPQMFMSKKSLARIQVWLRANFPRILKHEIEYRVGKAQDKQRIVTFNAAMAG